MKISRLGGLNQITESLAGPDKVEALFEADGTINPGEAVALDTGNLLGKLVVACPASANSDHLFAGIYEGKGGSGAETTTTGLTGTQALDGDIILITVYGVAQGLLDGGTTDCADGNALTPSVATAGELQSLGTTFDAGAIASVVCLEAETGAGPAVHPVFVRTL